MKIQHRFSSGLDWCTKVVHNHSDLVSSLGILSITSCLFAAKIFPQIPPLIPRFSLVVLNFTGIISLNMQARDVVKSAQDFCFSLKINDLKGMALTAVKVAVKGINTLLTVGMFGAAIIAFCGFPQVTTMMYLAMRPFAVIALTVGIASDVADYFLNEELLKKFETVSNPTQLAEEFTELVVSKKSSLQVVEIHRQLDMQVIETFQDNLKSYHENEKIFPLIQESLQSKQMGTETNLSLIVMGYIAMGICRMFPDSIAEMATRWSISMYYTGELIRQKIFRKNLESQLIHP